VNYFQDLKPKISKRKLLFLAAFVWTFAGGILLYRGAAFLYGTHGLLSFDVLYSIAGGILFYLLLFSGISLKNTRRIMDMKNEKPCLFSFFSLKSYIIMAVMITSGILVRKTGIILPENLSFFFIVMGIPLLLSAFHFYYHGIYYEHDKK
jgi:hypothetical protein